MRRTLAMILTALGAFLVVTALLVRFYAYPTLATAPQDRNSITRLEASDATVFSIDEMRPITTDLSVATTTRGNVKAAEKEGGNTVVWTGTTTVWAADGSILSQSTSSSAFDGNTSEAIDCCDNFVESTQGQRETIKRTGLVYKFPFNTEKKDYMFFDDTARAAFKAAYKGEEKIQGVTTYKFVQEIPRTVVGSRSVPLSVLGGDDDSPVTANSVYANTRTMWVEPRTGGFIDRSEEQSSTLEFGELSAIATQATIHYTDAQVKESIDDLKGDARLLGLASGFLPWLLLVLGLAMAVVGFVMRRNEPAEAHGGAQGGAKKATV